MPCFRCTRNSVALLHSPPCPHQRTWPQISHLVLPFSSTHLWMHAWCANRCVPAHEHGLSRFPFVSSSCHRQGSEWGKRRSGLRAHIHACVLSWHYSCGCTGSGTRRLSHGAYMHACSRARQVMQCHRLPQGMHHLLQLSAVPGLTRQILQMDRHAVLPADAAAALTSPVGEASDVERCLSSTGMTTLPGVGAGGAAAAATPAAGTCCFSLPLDTRCNAASVDAASGCSWRAATGSDCAVSRL